MGSTEVVLATLDQDVVMAVADAVEAGGGRLTVTAGGPIPAAARTDLLLLGADLLLSADVPPVPDPERCYAVSAGGAGLPGLWRIVGERGLAGVLELPDGGPWLAQRLQARQLDPAPVGPLITVLSAVGGAGASTVAAGLAVLAAGEGNAVVVDADPGAAGLEALLGLVDAQPHLARFQRARGRLPRGELAGLPMAEGTRVLGWAGQPPDDPAWPECLPTLLPACRSGGAVAVVDIGTRHDLLPYLPGDAHVVLVVPARLRAVAVAAQLLGQVQASCAGVTLLLRDVGGRTEPVAWARHLPGAEVVVLDHDHRAVDDEDHGRPPGTRQRSSATKALRRALQLATQGAA